MHKSKHRNKSKQNTSNIINNKKFEKEMMTSYSLATDGRAIGRDQNNVITFIKNMLPNETAKIEITSKKSNFKNATICKIEIASPFRVNPPCSYVSRCGGCQIQHVSNEMQTIYKTQWFLETLKRIGKWDNYNIELAEKKLEVVYLPKDSYRRRIRLHFDGKNLGFKASQTNLVTDINSCFITSKRINNKIPTIKNNLITALKIINEKNLSKNFECEIEATESDDHKVILNITSLNIDHPAEKKQIEKILEKTLEIQNDQMISMNHPQLTRFKLKKQSFIQPHKDCINSYYKHIKESVAEFLQKIAQSNNNPDTLLAWDLYAGAGVFSGIPYFLAKKYNLPIRCIGVEGVPEAIDSLINNYKTLPIEGIVSDVFEFIEQQFNLKLRADKTFHEPNIIIIDPPRSGCGIQTMQKIVEICSKKSQVLYLACDPASFARDTWVLLKGGFKLQKLCLFDSFGQTVHYEVLGCFEK